MITTLLFILGWMGGIAITEVLLRRHKLRKAKKEELKASWSARDLDFKEREVNARLYELDPALAIELGYEPLEEKLREVETPTGIPGETMSSPFQNLLAPGLKQLQQDHQYINLLGNIAEQQRQAGYFDYRQMQQQSNPGTAGQLLGGLLGSYAQQASRCTCGGPNDPFQPGAHHTGCPRFRAH